MVEPYGPQTAFWGRLYDVEGVRLLEVLDCIASLIQDTVRKPQFKPR